MLTVGQPCEGEEQRSRRSRTCSWTPTNNISPVIKSQGFELRHEKPIRNKFTLPFFRAGEGRETVEVSGIPKHEDRGSPGRNKEMACRSQSGLRARLTSRPRSAPHLWN